MATLPIRSVKDYNRYLTNSVYKNMNLDIFELIKPILKPIVTPILNFMFKFTVIAVIIEIIIVIVITSVVMEYGLSKSIKCVSRGIAKIIGFLSVVMLVYLIFFYDEKPLGYCQAKQRFLTDQEFIEIGLQVQKQLELNNVESARTFYINNPNCCLVSRYAHSRSHSAAFFDAVNVHITYHIENNVQNKEKTDAVYYDDYLTINPCGHIDGRYFDKKVHRYNKG